MSDAESVVKVESDPRVKLAKERDPLYCSFCGKSQHEVRKLIAGPTVFICNECVELCMDIVEESEPLVNTGRIGPLLNRESLKDLMATGLDSVELLRDAGVDCAINVVPPLDQLLGNLAAVIKDKLVAANGIESITNRLNALRRERESRLRKIGVWKAESDAIYRRLEELFEDGDDSIQSSISRLEARLEHLKSKEVGIKTEASVPASS